MTEEEVEDLVLGDGDVSAIADAFTGLDDRQRKKLSSTARQLYRQLIENKTNDTASER